MLLEGINWYCDWKMSNNSIILYIWHNFHYQLLYSVVSMLEKLLGIILFILLYYLVTLFFHSRLTLWTGLMYCNLLCRNVFRHELTLLEKVRHPNVVQFIGAVTQNIPMMIVLEYHSKVIISLYTLLSCKFVIVDTVCDSVAF